MPGASLCPRANWLHSPKWLVDGLAAVCRPLNRVRRPAVLCPPRALWVARSRSPRPGRRLSHLPHAAADRAWAVVGRCSQCRCGPGSAPQRSADAPTTAPQQNPGSRTTSVRPMQPQLARRTWPGIEQGGHAASAQGSPSGPAHPGSSYAGLVPSPGMEPLSQLSFPAGPFPGRPGDGAFPNAHRKSRHRHRHPRADPVGGRDSWRGALSPPGCEDGMCSRGEGPLSLRHCSGSVCWLSSWA